MADVMGKLQYDAGGLLPSLAIIITYLRSGQKVGRSIAVAGAKYVYYLTTSS